MPEKEVRKVIERVLKECGCGEYTFKKLETKEKQGFSVVMNVSDDEALKVYQAINNVNLYGFGWLVRKFEKNEKGEQRIGIEKV
jgi:hypothetical protein